MQELADVINLIKCMKNDYIKGFIQPNELHW